MRRVFPDATWRRPELRGCSQAGLVNNLNDALAWGLVPLLLAAHGASVSTIGLGAAVYPAVWGIGQIWTGHWLDRVALGAGTALVYPALIAAISDSVSPIARAPTVGVYRFWRDMGYVAGGLIAGSVADALGFAGAIGAVAALTAASGILVAIDLPARNATAVADDVAEAEASLTSVRSRS